MIFNLLMYTLLGMILAWPVWVLVRWWGRRIRGYAPQDPMRWVTPYQTPSQRAESTDRTSV